MKAPLKATKGGEARKKAKKKYPHPLKDLLEDRGQSIRWLSQQTGYSESYLRQICRREKPLPDNPKSLFLIRLKAALDCTLDDLVLGRYAANYSARSASAKAKLGKEK